MLLLKIYIICKNKMYINIHAKCLMLQSSKIMFVIAFFGHTIGLDQNDKVGVYFNLCTVDHFVICIINKQMYT